MIGLKEVEEWVKKAEAVRQMLVNVPGNRASYGTGSSAMFVRGQWILYAWEDLCAEGTDLEAMIKKLDELLIARANKAFEEAQRSGIVAECALARLGQPVRPMPPPPDWDGDIAKLTNGSIVQWGGKQMIKGQCTENHCNACCRLGYHLDDPKVETNETKIGSVVLVPSPRPEGT